MARPVAEPQPRVSSQAAPFLSWYERAGSIPNVNESSESKKAATIRVRRR